ncbi:MAG TPA: T9SS type A sorting domain-containing protein, partial [Firmicutes bacterium]|nr:T9SS type A sorting domain-containing protein [Bacillota bacterium]
VRIMSLNGKVLLSENCRKNELKWNAEKLPGGTYMVTVKIENNLFRKFLNVIR